MAGSGRRVDLNPKADARPRSRELSAGAPRPAALAAPQAAAGCSSPVTSTPAVCLGVLGDRVPPPETMAPLIRQPRCRTWHGGRARRALDLARRGPLEAAIEAATRARHAAFRLRRRARARNGERGALERSAAELAVPPQPGRGLARCDGGLRAGLRTLTGTISRTLESAARQIPSSTGRCATAAVASIDGG